VPAGVSCRVSSVALTVPSRHCSVMSLPVGVFLRMARKWLGHEHFDRQETRCYVTVSFSQKSLLGDDGGTAALVRLLIIPNVFLFPPGPLCPAPNITHGALFLPQNASCLSAGPETHRFGLFLFSVVCPAGSFFQQGACLLCPQGTYQEKEGRDTCDKCPRGSSPAGSSSASHCETDCERRGLRCSQQGDFLPAQPDFLSGRWKCFSSEGAELEWTTSDKPLTDDECSGKETGQPIRAQFCPVSDLRPLHRSVLSRFQTVPGSDLMVRTENAEVLRTMTSDLSTCVQACAAEPSCHHVALFDRQTQCELYSTHTLNTLCNSSQQDISVSLQGSGFLGNPQVERFQLLNCSLSVRGGASDLLVLRKNADDALPADSKNKKDYQASIISFQAIYLNTGCDEEEQCSVADLREAESDGFFSCSLYPDTRVCGAYDQPIKRPCRPLLVTLPNNTYSKKGEDGSLRFDTE
ncbi:hypothetical protein GOODEAATRI_019899, partial [Goodea atripinnis]